MIQQTQQNMIQLLIQQITNSNSETGNETTTVTTNKGRNLGVTTTQQMLISELDFRASYNFFNNLVYKNVDEVLTSKIY